ncbi:MAG: resolvase [Pseudanabaenaceae cyanobacterium bins.68]|nr:resolvase [Pseudanabaenaceae cyanobacterium bins.68]
MTEYQSNLMDIEAVQKILHKSRASIYRYANTSPTEFNLPFDPKRLNPELRQHPSEPIMFHPNEVSRFARDVLKVQQVTIQVQEPASTLTNQLLQEILQELKLLRQHFDQS